MEKSNRNCSAVLSKQHEVSDAFDNYVSSNEITGTSYKEIDESNIAISKIAEKSIIAVNNREHSVITNL